MYLSWICSIKKDEGYKMGEKEKNDEMLQISNENFPIV